MSGRYLTSTPITPRRLRDLSSAADSACLRFRLKAFVMPWQCWMDSIKEIEGNITVYYFFRNADLYLLPLKVDTFISCFSPSSASMILALYGFIVKRQIILWQRNHPSPYFVKTSHILVLY